MIDERVIDAIAFEHYEIKGKQYVVITDSTPRDFVGVPVAGKNYVIVHTSNNYDSAVKTANFWDERMNTHFVEMNSVKFDKMKVKKRLVDILVKDMSVPHDHELRAKFDALSVSDVTDVMYTAAMRRIG